MATLIASALSTTRPSIRAILPLRSGPRDVIPKGLAVAPSV